MKIYLLLLALITTFSLPAISQDNLAVNNKEADYNRTIDTRSEKIVASLSITDATKANSVKNIIADQYKNLNTIYTSRDLQIKTVKEKAGSENKEAVNEAVDKIKAGTITKVDSLHQNYISLLSKDLTAKQIDQVKDGMTYNVVQVTFNGYNQMIRTLTNEQKQQIMVWLVEAREHAMDAESSEKKHAWFGKYKGRINNYLSAAGYDLKKEGEDWQVRIKEDAAKKKEVN